MFKITEHLDKLNNVKHHLTWGEAECPVCGGILKFSKSGSKQDSYACYSNECHKRRNAQGVNLIKQKLAPYSYFNNSNLFIPKKYFTGTIKLMSLPLPVTAKLQLFSDFTYIRPVVVENPERTQRQILFNYSDFQLVRVEKLTEEGTTKYFYPVHLNENKRRVKGLPETENFSVIYRDNYIQRDVIIVEGEKCATLLQKMGFAAISIYSSFISSTTLDSVFEYLKNKGVENIIYLLDNDIPGKHKAELMEQHAWKLNINLTSINLVDIYPEFKDCIGFDVADLYVEGLLTSKERFDLVIQAYIENATT